jgi:hypothetical protein
VKRRDLEQHLRQHGCRLGRHGRGHDIWENVRIGSDSSVPRHREVKPGLVRKICKDLQIPAPKNPN